MGETELPLPLPVAVAAAAPSSPVRQWVSRHRRMLGALGRLVALVVIARVFVIPQLGRISDWREALAAVQDGWVPIAVAVEIGSLVLYTLTTRILLTPRTRPPYHRVARIDLSAIALGHCLPDGGAAGTALCWRLLVADGVPTVDAGVAKIAQGLVSAVILMGLLLGGILTGTVLSGQMSPWAFAPTATAAAFIALVLVIGYAVVRQSARARVDLALRRIPRFGTGLADALDGLGRRDEIHHLRSVLVDPSRSWVAVGLAGGNWVLDAIVLWVCLRAFGAGVGLEALAVVYAIQAIGTWIPLTPSGLGLSESLMIPALIAFGTPAATAALGVLAWRLVAFWLPIPLGAAAYVTLGRRSAAADRR